LRESRNVKIWEEVGATPEQTRPTPEQTRPTREAGEAADDI